MFDRRCGFGQEGKAKLEPASRPTPFRPTPQTYEAMAMSTGHALFGFGVQLKKEGSGDPSYVRCFFQ